MSVLVVCAVTGLVGVLAHAWWRLMERLCPPDPPTRVDEEWLDAVLEARQARLERGRELRYQGRVKAR